MSTIFHEEYKQYRNRPIRVVLEPKPFLSPYSMPFTYRRSGDQLINEINHDGSVLYNLIFDRNIRCFRKPYANISDSQILQGYKAYYGDAYIYYMRDWQEQDFYYSNNITEEYKYLYDSELEHSLYRHDYNNPDIRFYCTYPNFTLVALKSHISKNYANLKDEHKISTIPAILLSAIRSSFDVIKEADMYASLRKHLDFCLSHIDANYEIKNSNPVIGAVNNIKDLYDRNPSQDNAYKAVIKEEGMYAFPFYVGHLSVPWETPTNEYIVSKAHLFNEDNKAHTLIGKIPKQGHNPNFLFKSRTTNMNRGFMIYMSIVDDNDNLGYQHIHVEFKNIAFTFNRNKVYVYIRSKTTNKFRLFRIVDIKKNVVIKNNTMCIGVYIIHNSKDRKLAQNLLVIDPTLLSALEGETDKKNDNTENQLQYSVDASNVRRRDKASETVIKLPKEKFGSNIINGSNYILCGDLKVFSQTNADIYFGIERLIYPQATFFSTPDIRVVNNKALFDLTKIKFENLWWDDSSDITENIMSSTLFKYNIKTYKPNILDVYDVANKLSSEVYETPPDNFMSVFKIDAEWFSNSPGNSLYLDRIIIRHPGVYVPIESQYSNHIIDSKYIEDASVEYGEFGEDVANITINNINNEYDFLLKLSSFRANIQIRDAKDTDKWNTIFVGETNLSTSSPFIDSSFYKDGYEKIKFKLYSTAHQRLSVMTPIWRTDYGGRLHTEVLRDIYFLAGFVYDDMSISAPGLPVDNPVPAPYDYLPFGEQINSYAWSIEPPNDYAQFLNSMVNKFSGWLHYYNHVEDKVIYKRRPTRLKLSDVSKLWQFVSSEEARTMPNSSKILSDSETLYKIKPICDSLILISGLASDTRPVGIIRTSEAIADSESEHYINYARVVFAIHKAALSYESLKAFADILAPRLLYSKRIVTFSFEMPYDFYNEKEHIFVPYEWINHHSYGSGIVINYKLNLSTGIGTIQMQLAQQNINNEQLATYYFSNDVKV